MLIDAAFDSGNIEVRDATEPSRIRLALRRDVGGVHHQWFHFRVTGARGVPLVLHIEDLADASFAAAWPITRAVCSTDGERWHRVPTRYEDGTLRIAHTPDADVVWYAYFAPYDQERLGRLVARAARRARVEALTTTLDGAPLHLIRAGAGPARVWVLGRQHAGEAMASWFLEGLLERLLDPVDAVGRAALAEATFHVVPCVNPDGARRGHIRTNAAGVDLNRAWGAPDPATAPEVAAILTAMDAAGVDLCLDVHGDEERPYNFIVGPEGIPSFGPSLAEALAAFKRRWVEVNPEFQAERGYAVPGPGQANMAMCTNAVAERFGCLAMTIEQPFQDVDHAPEPLEGWSPGRARRLGASVLHPIRAHVRDL